MKLHLDNKPEILIVDGFYENPDQIRAMALEAEFQENPADHKGLRSKARFLFDYVRERFQELLGRQITQWTEHGMNGRFQICPAGTQTVYHSDFQSHAGIIYLNPDAPPSSGTRFFRSRATGLRWAPGEADGQRLKELTTSLERRQYEGKLLDPTAWEEVDRVGNVYNRLALWRGDLCHAAGDYFGSTKETSRLTHIFFFDCEGGIA